MNIIASNRPFPNRTLQKPDDFGTLLIEPKVIFFPFWSWKVPNEILKQYTCIGFHTGDIKGGSPIQNIIRRGEETSFVKMFKMNDTIDGGEILDTAPISLLGSLEEITMRMSKIMEDMIHEFQKNNR